jgi:hypothetical protein
VSDLRGRKGRAAITLAIALLGGAIACSGDGVIDLLPEEPAMVPAPPSAHAACPPARPPPAPAPAPPAMSVKPMQPADPPCDSGPCPSAMPMPACVTDADAGVMDATAEAIPS